MNKRELETGNAVLIALFVAIMLIALLAVQTVSTRANLKVTEQRTSTAQLTAQSIFSTSSKVRTLSRLLSQESSDLWTPMEVFDGSAFENLTNTLESSFPCNTSGLRTKLTVAQAQMCGFSHPGLSSSRASFRNTTQWDVPLLLQVTARLPDGTQRTRQVSGSLNFTTSSDPVAPLNISAMQLLTNTVTVPFPSEAIFDGPVHVNNTPEFDSGRSEWPGGLSTASTQLSIGSQNFGYEQFKPNPAFPCDQTSSTCPNFGGGLSLNAASISLPDARSTSGALNLPGNVRELVLFPVSGGTGLFACTSSSCDVYQVSGGSIWRIQSGVEVPGRSGNVVDTSVQEGAATGATQALIIAPGPIEVRSLTPTGSAYSGTLSIMSRQGLTVSSSLIASSPVCTTYPVRNAAGSTEPATCNGESSNDGLGLISERGDIHIGEPTQSLVSGDTSLTLQASLLAPRGNIAIQDSRLETVDWIGSAASDSFTPTRRLRLAYDPRALALPGFPEMPGSLTPVRVSFETERDLD